MASNSESDKFSPRIVDFENWERSRSLSFTPITKISRVGAAAGGFLAKTNSPLTPLCFC